MKSVFDFISMPKFDIHVFENQVFCYLATERVCKFNDMVSSFFFIKIGELNFTHNKLLKILKLYSANTANTFLFTYYSALWASVTFRKSELMLS